MTVSSVCLSVTIRHCVRTAKHIVEMFSSHCHSSCLRAKHELDHARRGVRYTWWNCRDSPPITLYFGNGTRWRYSYNGRLLEKLTNSQTTKCHLAFTLTKEMHVNYYWCNAYYACYAGVYTRTVVYIVQQGGESSTVSWKESLYVQLYSDDLQPVVNDSWTSGRRQLHMFARRSST